jgi:hypothetical protein
MAVFGPGRVGGADLRLQAEQAFRNLRTALEAAGASPADVVFVRLYGVDYRPECAAVLGPMLEGFFPADQLPASTWVGVQSLAVPGFLVEIEATAVVSAWRGAAPARLRSLGGGRAEVMSHSRVLVRLLTRERRGTWKPGTPSA